MKLQSTNEVEDGEDGGIRCFRGRFLVLDTLCAPADAMPPKGGATFVDSMTMTVAGTVGAAALDCAMLGLKVRIAAAIGNDPMGEWLASELEANGVDTALLNRTSEAQTSMSMLPIGTDGARAAFLFRAVPVPSSLMKRESMRLWTQIWYCSAEQDCCRRSTA